MTPLGKTAPAPRIFPDEALNEFVEAVQESTLGAAPAFEGASLYSGGQPRCGPRFRGRPLGIPRFSCSTSSLTWSSTTLVSRPTCRKQDRTLERAPALVICVGSDVRMMDELVIERAPLHGRPTLELHALPLDPRAVGEITGAERPEDAFDRYLVVGGFPLMRDLQAERVIEAIGHGETAHGRIADRSGVKGNTLTAALDALTTQKQLVTRSVPYAVPAGKQPARYTVIDSYLRFWLRFVGPHIAERSRGRGDLVIARIERDWATYRGRAVEPIVREALERLLADPQHADRLGGARHVGSWWKRDHSIEVDLAGGDAPVPGAAAARLVAVSRGGLERGAGVDEAFGPAELLAAWGGS